MSLSERRVVTDANILYSAQLRALFMNLALMGHIELCWTTAIVEEWITALVGNRPDITRERLTRTADAMNAALLGANVEGYEPLIGHFVLPDPDDRHVAAAALHAGAPLIVTFNLNDFPAAALTPHGLVAIHPDRFLSDLAASDPLPLVAAARVAWSALRRPPIPADQWLASLDRLGLSKTAGLLRHHQFAGGSAP
jgi:predicted nucleic acid-binding protein